LPSLGLRGRHSSPRGLDSRGRGIGPFVRRIAIAASPQANDSEIDPAETFVTFVHPGRLLGEGLTKAADVLSGGSDEAHLHDAALHLARALGASSVALLATVREGESLHLVADSDEHRSDADLGAFIAAPELRKAMALGEAFVVRDGPRGVAVDSADAGVTRARGPGTWAAFPVLVRRKARGLLVARFPYVVDELPDVVTLCGRAAAALIAVILPGAKALDPIKERTRKITLIDVPRERRLRAIERYRSFIDSASDGIVVLDATGTVLYMNRAAEQVTGYARDGLAGRSWAQIVPEAQRPILAKQLIHATQSRPVENFDLDLVTTSGDRITVSVASIGILAEYGAAIFAFRDVTLARELEIELRRTTEFLERILNSAVDGIIAADMRGTILLFNHSAERICGYRASEVIGKVSVTEMYPPGVAQEIMRLLRSSQRGGGGRLEPVRRELKAVTGELIPVSISAALVFDDAGHEIATVGIFSDLRERLRMEERLATAQEKLAISEKQVVAIELAGAAAHELNQPLTSVMGYAQIMLRKLEPDSPHLRPLETILAESERMASIVRQLGSLTRYETKSYVGGAQIIDLDRSAEGPDD
jgi:PAS domain S-box-containing protein